MQEVGSCGWETGEAEEGVEVHGQPLFFFFSFDGKTCNWFVVGKRWRILATRPRGEFGVCIVFGAMLDAAATWLWDHVSTRCCQPREDMPRIANELCDGGIASNRLNLQQRCVVAPWL